MIQGSRNQLLRRFPLLLLGGCVGAFLSCTGSVNCPTCGQEPDSGRSGAGDSGNGFPADGGDGGIPRDGGVPLADGGGDGGFTIDAGAAQDAGDDGGLTIDAGTAWPGPPPTSLPVTYTRPDVGTPLTQAEIDAATDSLATLLRGTHYFDVVDERIHGWPEGDGGMGFFWGEWWSGVTLTKDGGVVTYTHPTDGSDNDGLRTAPLLEAACYARLMWGTPLAEDLIRRLTRGFSADALAMVRSASDTAGTMLARTHYGPDFVSTDHGRTLVVNMSADRPGVNGTSDYVNLPQNPTFGNIWIKNNRSKDDMGHVFRAIIQSQACAAYVSPDAQADLAQTVQLYAAYSRQVEAAGWGIATLDTNAQVLLPPKTSSLAWYFLTGNVECPGALMMALLGDGAPGALACDNGISLLETIGSSLVKNSNEQILRSSQEAAVNASFYTPGQAGPGLTLLQGLATRVENGIAEVAAGTTGVNPSDIAALILHAANAGLPLTSLEVRYVYGQLALASQAFLAPANLPTYVVFDPATPDGTYAYEPPGAGFDFGDLGLLLGQCAAPYRNPSTRTMFDCARLAAAF